MARGTRLWQAPRSPLIQGRSRTETPYWSSAAVSLLVAGLVTVLYEFATSDVYGPSLSSLPGLANAFITGVQLALAPSLFLVWIGRLLRWSRLALKAGLAGGLCAVALLFAGVTLPW